MKVKNILNDPEYRWYHKDEMSKIMPYPTMRKQYGIKIINYTKLRCENDSKITLCKDRDFRFERLKYILDSVPSTPDKSKRKKKLDPRDRLHFERRGMGTCWICGQINHYGSNNEYSMYDYKGYGVSHLHHIIPNGDATDENIITLCSHCHQVVHHILYLLGKCKYARPL